MKDDLRPMRADLKPDSAAFRSRRADFRPETAKIRSEWADFMPGSADSRLEASGRGEVDGRTDRRMKITLWGRAQKGRDRIFFLNG